MRRFKYAVILSSTDEGDDDIDDENEIQVSRCEVFTNKVDATRVYKSWLSGRTNMDVVLVKVEAKARGTLS